MSVWSVVDGEVLQYIEGEGWVNVREYAERVLAKHEEREADLDEATFAIRNLLGALDLVQKGVGEGAG